METSQRSQKRKHRAIKGFLILIIILLICVFLSGTLKKISTANVYTVVPTYGRLKESIHVSGLLSFSESEGYPQISVPEDVTLTIKQVYAAPGLKVKEGDLLAEACVSNLNKLQSDLIETYDEESKKLASLVLENNTSIRITSRDENWVKAYDAYQEAQRVLLQTQLELQHAAEDMDIHLTDSMALPNDCEDVDILKLYHDMISAQKKLDETQTALEQANRQGYSQVAVNNILEEREIQRKMAQIREDLFRLQSLNESVMEIRAPHDGYVLQINIQEEETWSGDRDMLIISGENAVPILQVNIEEISKSVPVGNPVSIQGRHGNAVTGIIDRKSIDFHGNTLAEIELNVTDLPLLGNMSELLVSGTNCIIPLEAEEDSILIPASAVRGSGNTRYVYEMVESENLLGQKVYTAKKVMVKVIEAADQMASISDDLSMNSPIIYMEDRGISDGAEVIPVSNAR